MLEQEPQLTAGLLFSGMGGFASGIANAGFNITWANDNDEYACLAFRYNFPDVPLVEKDVRDLSVRGDALADVDVLAAGFPCQSFSQAGGRRGFEDPRGELFFEIPRILEEFTPERRPRLVILENVPYLLYGAEGAWFDAIRRALRQAGYWFRDTSCWTVNVKDATDLPQDRHRLFMVAASRHHFSYNPFAPPLVNGAGKNHRPLHEFIDRTRPGAEDAYLPPDNRYYKMIDSKMATGESEANIYQLRRSYVREKKNGLCPTLTANMGIGGHNVPFVKDVWGIRKLSVDEVARFQGFDGEHPPLFPDIPVSEQYRLLGNAVCVELAHMVGNQCAEILKQESAQ
jgi:DNA (cytosine-5)-methyltransferase 1